MSKKTSPKTPTRRPAMAGFSWPEDTGLNLLILTLFTLLLFQRIWMNPGEMLWASDIVRAHVEYKTVQWRSFWEWGTFPLWDPTVFGGKSIVGDAPPALLNPLSVVFWLSPNPALFGFLLFIKVTFSAWGMYLFARRRECGALGALTAAIVFACSGKTAAHVFAGHVELLATVLGLPWMLWALERLLQRKTWRNSVLLGAIMALVATNGSVQMMYWNILFLLAYFLCRLFELRPTTAILRGETGRFIAALAAFAVIGCAWWFPIVRQTLLLSARSSEITYDFATMNSLQPMELLRSIWPFWGSARPAIFAPDPALGFFWESASYPGITALLLAATLAITCWREAVVRNLAIMAALMILLALGENSPLHWLAYNLVPGFSLFRAPARLLFYAILPIALLAGMAVTRARATNFGACALLVALVLAQVALIFPTIVQRGLNPVINGGVWVPLGITLVLLVLSSAMHFRVLHGKGWALGCLLVLAAELIVVWQPHVLTVPVSAAFPVSPVAEFLEKQRGKGAFRIMDTTGLLEQQHAARSGLEVLTGYHPGVYRHYMELYKAIWKGDSSSITQIFDHDPTDAARPAILDMMNVKYVVTYRAFGLPNYTEVFRYALPTTSKTAYVYERGQVLPRAYITGRAEVPPVGASVLEYVGRINSREGCVVEDAPTEGGAEFQAVELQRSNPGDYRGTVSTANPGVLILAEAWHPDWCATINGEPASIRRVNHAQMGIVFPAGKHAVRLWYWPWDFYLGLGISGAGMLVLLISSAAGLR